ncbi:MULTISPECIES: YeeE/YedE family protein [unclassified Streptomyces]|uniref:YeeE/YedE family protein n=1 Tax=unclassified Streptomyces TaxID=2593676 RepID=UPI002DDB16A6|nr:MULTISPECIES: YeeE/YedE family protein [unclassified Streptomyces]WSA95629.1 YeeE/YedE family protein [Streptomyces sp. NBC_01795]WSB80047.1 YeeE/YedE family protein [Streptomyces sp. NBC_01775]WSS40458.1 YeeE/YedE family protein [Streptomyces sp. NBC_01187]
MTTAPPAEAQPPVRTGLLPPSPTSAPAPEAAPAPAVRWLPLAVALVIGLALTGYVWAAHGTKPGVLLLLGIGLGVGLFHSRFGFTSAWRQLIAVGNGTGLRAHALLLGTTATLFALIIGTGTGLFGSVPAPSAGPLGAGLLVGAFLFAVGMQLGGACASGTLFAVGSGQSTIVLTLGGFIVGSTLAAWQYGLWGDLPAFDPVVFSDHLGWGGSLAVTLVALAAVVLISRRVQSRRNPPPVGAPPSARGTLARVVRGSWPLAAGALVLAVLGGAVLLVSGGAWGITSAFALWGSKLVGALGGSPESWAFWQDPKNAQQLAGPVLADKTSLTDLGIMIGAAVAAAAGGVWTLHRGVPWRTAVAAVLGGVLMGIGARLAGGCNIGAYLAGIASGSLHGWIWGAVALGGTWAGLRLRPYFGLGNPKPGDGVC